MRKIDFKLHWPEYSITTFSHKGIYGDWSLKQHPEAKILNLNKVKHLLNLNKIKTINFKEIAYKSFNIAKDKTHENCICCNGERYIKCNTDHLGILLKGEEYNNYNKKYRMLDGKHRIMKLKEMGEYEYDFYVLSYNEIKKYINE